MLSFCQWLQSTGFFTDLRGSGILYPAILSLHMVAIGFFGAMILMTDLRLLGLVMRKYPVSDLIDRFRTPKRIGLLLIVTCGVLLFGTKAEEYYYNSFFRTKMTLLLLVFLHAFIFRNSVYAKSAELDRAPQIPTPAKMAAVLSLLLWTGLVICGRGIGYIEPPLEKIHARNPVAPDRQPAARAYWQPAEPIATQRNAPFAGDFARVRPNEPPAAVLPETPWQTP